ncbi:MAG: hypothetical protein ACLP01_23290 [Solirubrobacteraceae bacterium]
MTALSTDRRSADRVSAASGARDLTAARLAVVVALISAVVGLVVIVGADARWLAALGQAIVRRGGIPAGIPFAAAPSGHWANTLVLAELAFGGLERAFGDRGLLVAEILAVAAALGILARDARAGGAGAPGISSALTIAAIGSLGSLAVARVQLFSLVLFPLLVALLRAEHRRPSRQIYLAVALLALWSNLHGAALLGLGVLWAYLALSRFAQDRPTAIAAGLLAPAAMCLTPAGVHTVDYYEGLLTNVAAQRGVGLWAPLGTSALDVLLVVAALALAFRARCQRPAMWELVVLALLALVTIKAARDGVWLLFMLVAPAAVGSRKTSRWSGLLPVGAAVAVALLAFDLARPLTVPGPSQALLTRALVLAHGTPILAEAIPAEQLALAGGRVWAGDPLDAFSHRVQGQYLDWLAGARSGRALLANQRIHVVVVGDGSPAQSLMASAPGFWPIASDRTGTVYVRGVLMTGGR